MLYSTCAPADRRHVYTRQAGATRKERPTSTVTFPLGPYSPALGQPLALTLELRGETVASVWPPVTGFSRRGISTLARNVPIADALVLVERSCALAGTANRTALCLAIEDAKGDTPLLHARLTRVVFLEIERILARLWALGVSARTANLTQLFEDALEQREMLFGALVEATGQRVFWGIAEPGGARDDIELDALTSALKRIEAATTDWRLAVGPRGLLGLAGTGVGKISADRAGALSGLAAAGSGAGADARREHPGGGYADLGDEIVWTGASSGTSAGDVAARLNAAVDDIGQSIAIISSATTALSRGNSVPSAAVVAHTADPRGTGRVEGPHGPIELAVTLVDDERVADLRIVPPGEALLAELPDLLTGSPLGKVPLILASLDLCVECLDL